MKSVEAAGGKRALSRLLGVLPNAVTYWTRHGGMRLDAALRWAWVTKLNLGELLTTPCVLRQDQLQVVPDTWRRTTPRKARKKKSISAAKVLDTITLLAARDPFRAPTVREIIRTAGINSKHPALWDPACRQLINDLKRKERLLNLRERIWREAKAVNVAARKVTTSDCILSRRNVAGAMTKPGYFMAAFPRRYLDWLISRLAKTGAIPACDPPRDVTAYWDREAA